MTQYAVTMAPIDGLTLAASYYDFGDMGNADGRQSARRWFVGQLTTLLVKYQLVMVKHYTHQHKEWAVLDSYSTVQHYENSAYSIGFAVNDNLSVSFTEENSERKHKAKSVI